MLTRAAVDGAGLGWAWTLSPSRLVSIGWTMAATCGAGAALETAAADPMEDAATEATATESNTLRKAGSVIGRNLAMTLRFPLSAAAA